MVKIYDWPLLSRFFRAEERLCYGSGWRNEMTPLVGSTQTVTEVRYSPECGRLVKLSGFWFQVYHLERANPYDMI